MSHNPNTVKSQHELNDGKRSSDVLLATIAKCERLQKQLDIAVKALKEYGVYRCKDSWFAEQALAEIKELDNEILKQE